MVWNLLSNAVKFTPRGGRVEVWLRRVESSYEIGVRDSGRGIPTALLPFVFEKFRQADGGITRATGGLGIGLAISRHLVELHGGTIEVTSDGEGCGATFVVKLPRASVRATPPSARPNLSPRSPDPAFHCPPELVGVRVLVVDDEEDARELLATILERCGAVVTPAASAEEALALLERSTPDVMLSDIGTHGEDGHALIAKVRARTEGAGGHVPAAALTSYARPEDRWRSLQAGYQMRLPKPAEPAEPAEPVAVVANLARMTIARAR